MMQVRRARMTRAHAHLGAGVAPLSGTGPVHGHCGVTQALFSAINQGPEVSEARKLPGLISSETACGATASSEVRCRSSPGICRVCLYRISG